MSARDLLPESFSSEFPRSIGRPANSALCSIGVRKLSDVAKMSEKELLSLHGVGPKAVKILKEELKKINKHLKQDG